MNPLERNCKTPSNLRTTPFHSNLLFLNRNCSNDWDNITLDWPLKPAPRNRQLCRTNKLFCYPLAECLTLASNTRSQAQFMDEHPDAGVVFESDQQLIQFMRGWAEQMEALNQRRKAAWQLGHDTLNWETESEKLVALVNTLIQDAS